MDDRSSKDVSHQLVLEEIILNDFEDTVGKTFGKDLIPSSFGDPSSKPDVDCPILIGSIELPCNFVAWNSALFTADGFDTVSPLTICV